MDDAPAETTPKDPPVNEPPRPEDLGYHGQSEAERHSSKGHHPQGNHPDGHQQQYAPAPFPAMTAFQAMSGLSPNSSRSGPKLPFVQPSSYLRPKTRGPPVPPVPTPMSPIDEEQMQGLVSDTSIVTGHSCRCRSRRIDTHLANPDLLERPA